MPIQRGLTIGLFTESGKTADFATSEVDADQLTQWAPESWPVAPDWQPLINRFLTSSVALQLGRFVTSRLAAGACVYPPEPFHALALTSLASVKVVVLGQDPYHGPGQAHGLAFSVPPGMPIPPSLRNIYEEIKRGDAQRPQSTQGGSLAGWAKQGVLLLNTCLTVEQGAPASHARQGWEALTDSIIQTISALETPIVFMLWGAHAQAKHPLIEGGSASDGHGGLRTSHLVLSASHPSPLSVWRPPTPFRACAHFVQANDFLIRHGRGAIVW